MSIKSESTPKKRRSLEINTRRLLRNRNVHGDENSKDCEADYLKTTAGKRRASLIARATIHPATRLASVATKMETSESVQVLTNDRLLEEPKIPASSRTQELPADFSSRQRRNERLIRSNIELIDRASRVTSGRSSARTLRPRYPRTPTPETALLLSPKLSKARQQRNSTPKALEIQKGANEKISSAFSGIPRASRNSTPRSTKIETPKSSRLKSQKVSKPKFNTPKKKSTTQTPKSGHKGTPKNEGTPRAKTPKGTPKSQKKEHSLVCQTCEEIFPEKKAMLRHQRFHGRSKTDSTNSTPNKVTLIRAQKTNTIPDTKFECDICRKTFRFISNLRSHRAIHDEQRSFECHSCQKSLLITLQEGGFIIHPSVVEKAENMDQQVDTRKCCHSDQKHVPTRGRVKKFMCDKCARTFVLESNLRIHMKTHTIDKMRNILKASASVYAAE